MRSSGPRLGSWSKEPVMPEQAQPQPKSQQVKVPHPPHRNDPGKRRFREEPEVSVQDSYRLNTIRVTLPGRATVDVIPAPEGQASVDPSTILGAESPVWIFSGCNAYGRLSTPEDQTATTAVLYERLEQRGWAWHPAVLMAPGREWVET